MPRCEIKCRSDREEEQSPQPCGSPHVTCPPGPLLHPASDGNGLRCRLQRREGEGHCTKEHPVLVTPFGEPSRTDVQKLRERHCGRWCRETANCQGPGPAVREDRSALERIRPPSLRQRPRRPSSAKEPAAWCAAAGAADRGSRAAQETSKPPQRGSPSTTKSKGLPAASRLAACPEASSGESPADQNRPPPPATPPAVLSRGTAPQHPPNLGCRPSRPLSSFYPMSQKLARLESGSNLLRHPHHQSQARQSVTSESIS
ncbi:uncharacterized protein [Callorhinus ursinus]|uniref:uncharacterized protein isoform X1 n=1 Tax=Callorhinus ursinus TaxID=34884 RepID=UPI003CD00797